MKSYYMLVTSLPRHNRDYKIKQTPISRIQLEKRLKLLTENERIILEKIIHCLWDSWFNPNLPLQSTLAMSKNLNDLNQSFIQEFIQWFFDIRSIIVALRLRQTESSPPTNPQELWCTQWTKQLIKNWDKSDFGLKYTYPWLNEVNERILKKDTVFVEDALLTIIWKYLNKIENGHFYDFEAIIIYLMRWNIVNYWSQINEKIASDIRGEMTAKILIENVQEDLL